MAGFQVPVMAGLLFEVAGKPGGVLFWHNGPIGAKVGVMEVVTTIIMVALVAH